MALDAESAAKPRHTPCRVLPTATPAHKAVAETVDAAAELAPALAVVPATAAAPVCPACTAAIFPAPASNSMEMGSGIVFTGDLLVFRSFCISRTVVTRISV